MIAFGGLKAIADVLKHNSTLQELSLCSNKPMINSDQKKEIEKILKQNSTLKIRWVEREINRRLSELFK